MIRLLRGRAKAGVEIRVIGRVSKSSKKIGPSGMMRMRFHTRTIIRDRRAAFIGSQSLRDAELDRRRELGLIIHERDIVRSLRHTFESDWATLRPQIEDVEEMKVPATGAVKRLAKVVVRDLPLEPVVQRALQQALRDMPGAQFAGNKFEHRLEDAVRGAVEDTVSHIVRETVEAEGRV